MSKSLSITTDGTDMDRPTDNLPPIHPGAFLRDELDALGLSARQFGAHIRVPPAAISGVLNGKRPLTAQLAIRFGKAFGTTPEYWLNLQSIHDLKIARAAMGEAALDFASYAAA